VLHAQQLDKIRYYFIEYDIPHDKIWFEVTETATISALSKALHFLTTLRDLGCLISLDDFGAGLLSFRY
jgi:EAL domain-containing protein (putative c-di-GMP-specific phosphodiesterase class I)